MNPTIKKNPFGNAGSIEAYRKTDILTANKETILLMLYSGAIRFTRKALEGHAKGDHTERNKNLLRVQDIVNELRSTLNFEAGGDLSKDLDGLYGYLTSRISQSMLKNTSEPVAEVLTILTTLNEGWEQAVAHQKEERAKKP